MLKQSIIVFLKELKCIIRDKKTFIFGLLLPLLLVPTMLLIIDFSMNGTQSQVADNVNIAINNKDNSFYEFCKAQEGHITIVEVSDAEQALDSGAISAYVTVDEDIDSKILEHKTFNLNIRYNDASINSMMAMPLLSNYENIFRSIIEIYSFTTVQDLSSSLAIKVPDSDLPSGGPQIDTSSLYFNMLVPMMLILYCCMGSSGTASELSAGEKERGTLEPLLSTGADRTALIIGKLFATTFMGMMSGLFTVIGLWGYLAISAKSNSVSVSAVGMITLLAVTLFVSMLFASVNLAIGVYAKSYKEAQTYMMPISIICLIPTFFTYTLDAATIGIAHLCVPILNVVCIIKEIFAGAINPLHVTIVLAWLLIYVFAAFGITLRLFKKENIVFRI